MTARVRLRLAAVAAVAALAACTKTSAPAAGALFNEPTALAFFRGVTTQSGADPASPIYPYRPYIAVANAGGNDLSILDGSNDTLVPATTPLRGLVYPVPGRPVLLASGDLGDSRPDLLVAVTAGDLPWLGGSQLEVIRTWAADGAVVGSVDLGADILALAPLPFDPAAPGTVKVAATLAGERIAVVTFSRSSAGDGTAIDVSGAQVVTSAPLGFQPLGLAVVPGDRTRVFAATREPIPPSSVLGVAEIDVTGTPVLAGALNAHAPTRLVAAARLAEAIPLSTAFDETAFAGQAPVDRVYAVLDESGCGLQAPIACGLVALDPVAGDLLPDPTPLGTAHAPFLAPIPLAGAAAVATSGPPAVPPDPAEPQYAGTYLRVAVTLAYRQTTAAAALATVDGALTFVDLARWDVPSEQSVHANVKATVKSVRPTGTTGTQWLVLEGRAGVVPHLDPAGLSTAVGVTAGFTPTDRWTVAREGILPNLQTRRAEAGADGGGPWIALQQTGADGSVQDAVRLWDPTLGVRAGDTVVIDPVGLGTCGEFEAMVLDVAPPSTSPARPGGYVHLTQRVPANPAWDRCLALLAANAAPGGAPFFVATFRAGGYVLVRGTGTATVHVGRPEIGVPFVVAWQDETALASGVSACTLPPAAKWDPAAGCDASCRANCELLQRVRLARRRSYVPEPPSDLTGPALAFTLALEAPTAPVPRDLGLFIDTADGKAPFRVAASTGSPVDPRAVVPFDRSPWSASVGIRFLVPFAGGIVLDGTPTLPVKSASNTVH